MLPVHIIGNKRWEEAPLGSRGTKEEAIAEALAVRRGGYHSRILRRKHPLGFEFVRKRNGRVVKESRRFEYVVLRRWDSKKYPKDCLPRNMVGRRSS